MQTESAHAGIQKVRVGHATRSAVASCYTGEKKDSDYSNTVVIAVSQAVSAAFNN